MKGLIFTQLFDMVEQEYGYDLVDTLLVTTDLPSGGSYTPYGTYAPLEMSRLLTNLSQRTNRTRVDLLQAYGRFMFKRFVVNYRHFILSAPDAFAFLASVEAIHVEVKKLYPEAELPAISVTRPDERTLHLVYQSPQRMADLAYGLIEGALAHFHLQATIVQRVMNEDASRVRFTIVKSRVPGSHKHGNIGVGRQLKGDITI
jgi:hypothetical protein